MRYSTPPASTARFGSAMIAATALMVALVAIATTLTDLSTRSFMMQVDRRHQLEVSTAAESAANMAYTYLQDNYATLMGDSGALVDVDDSITVPLDTYTVDSINQIALGATITHVAGTTDDDYIWYIEGTATHGSKADALDYKRYHVEMIVSTTQSTYVTRAMFAIQGYTFGGSAQTDSYDSSVGPYSAGTANSNGDIGSMGSIVVTATVNGDVDDNQNIAVPTVDFAAELANETISTTLTDVTSSMTLTDAGSPYYMDSWELHKETVTIQGGEIKVFVNGPISWSQSAFVYDLATYPDSRLIVYQNDYDGGNETTFKLNGNDYVGQLDDSGGTVTADASRLILYSQYDGQMQLNGNGAMSGVIFAPNATVRCNGTFDMYGSVTALAFGTVGGAGQVNGNFSFHYDENLANMATDTTPTIVVSGWRSDRVGYHHD